MTSDPVVTASPHTSRWEDLVDVYFSPSELFARRARDTARVPFFMLVIITIVLYYVFLPLNGIMWDAAMAENASADIDAEKVRQGAAMMKYLGGLFVPFGYAFAIAVTAIVLKLASSLLEPAAGWREAFMIATFSMFVVIPQQVLGALLIFIKSGAGTVHMRDASFGVLRFMDKPDPVLRALLGRFDVFAIWSAVLCAIGLAVVVGMPRAKAAAAAAITWILIALPGVLGAILSGRKH